MTKKGSALFDYIDSADYDYKYAPILIFHCDYFTFTSTSLRQNLKIIFYNSTKEVGISFAFLLQSTLQFCFASSLLLGCN